MLKYKFNAAMRYDDDETQLDPFQDVWGKETRSWQFARFPGQQAQ